VLDDIRHYAPKSSARTFATEMKTRITQIGLIVGLLLLAGLAALLLQALDTTALSVLEDDYSPSKMATCANSYIQRGEEKAFRKLTRDYEHPPFLLSLALWPAYDRPHLTPRVGEIYHPFENALLEGWPRLSSEAKREWPNLPLIICDGVIFRAPSTGSHSIIGVSHVPIQYLEVCRSRGIFRANEYAIPTREQAEKALADLFESDRWRRIDWTAAEAGRNSDLGPWVSLRLSSEGSAKRALLAQVQRIE